MKADLTFVRIVAETADVEPDGLSNYLKQKLEDIIDKKHKLSINLQKIKETIAKIKVLDVDILSLTDKYDYSYK